MFQLGQKGAVAHACARWRTVVGAVGSRPWHGLFAAVLLARLASPYQPVIIWGESMSPALHSLQFVWMERRGALREPVRRGDIVVFRHDGDIYVKRVVAVDGDRMRLVHFPGDHSEPLEGTGPRAGFSRRLVHATHRCPRLGHVEPFCVPAGSLYVIGDNEPGSVDSRSFGPVPMAAVVGRLTTRAESSLAERATAGAFVYPAARMSRAPSAGKRAESM